MWTGKITRRSPSGSKEEGLSQRYVPMGSNGGHGGSRGGPVGRPREGGGGGGGTGGPEVISLKALLEGRHDADDEAPSTMTPRSPPSSLGGRRCKIEQELGTEITPIPPQIDQATYCSQPKKAKFWFSSEMPNFNKRLLISPHSLHRSSENMDFLGYISQSKLCNC